MEEKIKYYTERQLDKIPQIDKLDRVQLKEMQVVSSVLPFRVNNYVVDRLIDWDNIPDDPIFQLTFPQKKMLSDAHFQQAAGLLSSKTMSRDEVRSSIARIRQDLNPHPSEQMIKNIPVRNEVPIPGIQHKYKETVLFFPAQGQTCHSYCTFCFRWAQFIGDKSLRFSSSDADQLKQYLVSQPQVTDVIFTGGDPLVANTKNLKVYFEALLSDDLAHVKNIRIGTKALTYWPQRFLLRQDSIELLRLFEKVIAHGKHLTIMAHYNHWQELTTTETVQAIQAIRNTGAVIRSQGPILAHINDDPAIWSRLWKAQVDLGIFPYYVFVERDTGARNYFEVPLVRTWEIYRDAIKNVSGIARTARGPSMSADPGKVEIKGVAEIKGEKVFVLNFLQARNPDWCGRPFFAQYDPQATWFSQLKPAFGEENFFFQSS